MTKQTARRKLSTRQRDTLTVVGAVSLIVAAIAGTFIWIKTPESNEIGRAYSPEDAAKLFFAALAAGDVDGALSYVVDVPAAGTWQRTTLTDAIVQASLLVAPITDVVVSTESLYWLRTCRSDEVTLNVTFVMGVTSIATSYCAVARGSFWAIKALTRVPLPTPPSTLGLPVINGVTIPYATDAPIWTALLLPGVYSYRSTSSSPYLQLTSPTFAVPQDSLTQWPSWQLINPSPMLIDAAQTKLAECLGSFDPLASGCGVWMPDLEARDIIPGTFKWTTNADAEQSLQAAEFVLTPGQSFQQATDVDHAQAVAHFTLTYSAECYDGGSCGKSNPMQINYVCADISNFANPVITFQGTACGQS